MASPRPDAPPVTMAEVPLISMPAGYGSTAADPPGGHGRDEPRPAGGRLDGQRSTRSFIGSPAVPLHPAEASPAAPGSSTSREQRLPQVPVGHRLRPASCASPGAASPPTSVPEAVDDVGRVADHLDSGPARRPQGLETGGHLHPLVGRVGLAAALRRPAVHRPGPTPRAGVPEARPVGVDDRTGPPSSGGSGGWTGVACPGAPTACPMSAPSGLERLPPTCTIPHRRPVGAWDDALRRILPPAARHRSRARPRSGSTRSTPSSTPTGGPGPGSS